jgi:hypothetical protein
MKINGYSTLGIIYVKLFTVLYANDTVPVTESAEELKSELNYLYENCKKKKKKKKMELKSKREQIFQRGGYR